MLHNQSFLFRNRPKSYIVTRGVAENYIACLGVGQSHPLERTAP